MDKKITLYGTTTCPYCVRAKQFLEANQITFDYIDVSQNQGKAREMIKKSGQMGVPVIDIDGKIIVGFDKSAIEKEIEIQ